MRVLVTGDRNWTNRALIREALAELPPGSVVIHGAARGADTIAGEEASALGFEVLACPADWRRFGRAAGPRRNQLMLERGQPELVLAFHNCLAESKGTADMVRRAETAGVPVLLKTEEGGDR